MSRFTRKLHQINEAVTSEGTTKKKTLTVFKVKVNFKLPDGDDVREKHDEAEKVAEPRTHKPLQRYHDDRQNHLGQEQGLGEAVQLQVQKPDLSGGGVRGQITT